MRVKIGELRYTAEGVQIFASSERVSEGDSLWDEYTIKVIVDGKTLVTATTTSRKHFKNILMELLNEYMRW